jgi:O-antigen ligase
MDFAAAILVLVSYLLRLHQLVPGGEWLFAQKYLMAASALAMISRGRGFDWKQLFKTPLDWAVVLYLVFIVYHEEEHWETFKEVGKLFLFYAVTAQALCNSRRLFVYMAVWAGCTVVLALVTLDSAYGIDFSDSQSLLSFYNNRQCLNLSIYNTPNALGHTVILGLPMVLHAFFLGRGTALKLLCLPMWAAVLTAVYLTESKGAFVVGAALTVLTLWLGRSWVMRIILIAVLAGGGAAALKSLPRMEALQSSSAIASDEGIWGRLAVWNAGIEQLQVDSSGVGWKNFYPVISYVDSRGKMSFFQKGPHNSYVAVAAELGYLGLFFYLLVLAACLRVLVQFGGRDSRQVRAKLLILIVLLGYAISGWLIERPYHIEYFLIAGVCAAFQRLRLLGQQEVDQEDLLEDENAADPARLEAGKSPGRNELVLSPVVPSLLQPAEESARLLTSTQWQAPDRWLQPMLVVPKATLAIATPAPFSPPASLPVPQSQEFDPDEAPSAPGDLWKPLLWRRVSFAEIVLSLIACKLVLEIWRGVLYRFFW